MQPHVLRSGFLVALLSIAAVAGLSWVVLDHRGTSGKGSAPLSAEAQAQNHQTLLAAQQAQNARIERLEALLGQLAEAAGVPLQNPDIRQQQAVEAREHSLTAQQQDGEFEKALRAAEDQFHSETVTSGWATRNEKSIADAFAADNLAYKNAPTPRLHQATCRSKSCRIEMVYANEAAAEEGMAFLLSDIGGTFGRSRPFQRQLADGSVQLVVFASAATQRAPSNVHGH